MYEAIKTLPSASRFACGPQAPADLVPCARERASDRIVDLGSGHMSDQDFAVREQNGR